MAVHPVPESIARSGPPVRLQFAAELRAIEGHAFGASTALVYQRADLATALADQNDRALDAALAALDAGDVRLARQQIRTAQAAERAEDAAIRRAEGRRGIAHGHSRSIAGRVERTLTGRARP